MLHKETVTTTTLELLTELMRDEKLSGLSVEDIAAMKLNAIIGNGTRVKDFIDIAFISCILSLHQMTDAYEKKYASRNPVMVLKSLLYHEEINYNEPVSMISGAFEWEPIKLRLDEMVKYPDKVFSTQPIH